MIATPCDSNSIRCYNLKGDERAFTITPHGCARIAHALQVDGPVDDLLRHVVPAFRMVLNRHPKMRILMSTDPDEPTTGYVQPPFTSDTSVESLVTIIHHQGDKEDERQESVRKIMEDVGNKIVDRTTQNPYFLIVHVAKLLSQSMDTLTFLLFSDHAFSDGLSGTFVLNDLLVNISLLIALARNNDKMLSVDNYAIKAQLEEQCKQLPLRPPIYDQLRGPSSRFRCCTDRLFTMAARIIGPFLLSRFRPVLPSRESAALLVLTHRNFHSANTKLNMKIPKGIAGDVALSNLGRYPFPTVYNIGDFGEIIVKGMHFYSSIPHIAVSAAFFISSTDHLDYAIAHKMPDEDAAKLFKYVVKAVEAVSTIRCDQTMLEASEMIFKEVDYWKQ